MTGHATQGQVRYGLVEANSTQLYHEVRGDGSPLVCIPGAFGDAGGFEPMAELLADTHTVVTYDRRGNSRSPRPPGWTATSMAEQADDCAALIEALGLERPVVFGNSGGGTITVALLERHADMLRGAVVHEPVLRSVCPKTDAAFRELFAKMGEGMAAGGPEKLMEAFGRWVFGDDVFEAMAGAFDPEALERMSGNTEVLALEAPAFESFVPDARTIAAVRIPVHAGYGEENAGTFWPEGAEWVSEASGGPLHTFPGTHGPRPSQIGAYADTLRGILASMP